MGFLYIKKKDGERLGSQIQSIKNALYVGIHFNMNIKIGTNHFYTNKDKLPYIPDFIRINDSLSSEILFTHTFLNINSLCGEISPSLWIYKFLERDRVQDKIWKDEALKKNDDDPSWYMDGGVEDNALVNSGIALPKSTVE